MRQTKPEQSKSSKKRKKMFEQCSVVAKDSFTCSKR